MTEYTPKAQQTRQLILNTALDLFIRKGYEAATMREIAAEAKVSLGLAYRYFDSKEALVLSLYQQMAAETDNVVEKLPAGTVAQRFWLTMTTRLEQNLPYRDAFGALFGTMMTPKSNVELLSADAEAMRQRAESAFVALVTHASDSPRPAQIREVGRFLNIIHFMVILFWLLDRSAEQRATKSLLRFICDLLPWLLRGISFPFIRRELSRFITIVDSLFAVP